MMRLLLMLCLATVVQASDAWDRLAEISRKPAAEATVELERLLVDLPDFAAARYNLGTLLIEKDPSKAAEQLELAAREPSFEANAYHNLAIARFRQGRLDEALGAAERAARIDPQAVGTRDEIRRIALARKNEARIKAEEEAKKLHLNGTSLPVGRIQKPYRSRLPLAGGKPPYKAAIAGKTKLPEGIHLAAEGELTGTPLEAGSFSLDITVRDAEDSLFVGRISLTILPIPTITSEELPEAIVGQTYRAKLEQAGIIGSARWQIAGLPPGLVGNADGIISGTPSALGSSTITVHVDDGDVSANRLLDLEVTNLFAPAEDPLPAATVSTAYQHRMTVRGPAQEYRWSMAPASGLRVAGDGTLSGAPDQAGAVKLPATITAADGRSRTVTLNLPVNPLPLIKSDPLKLQAASPIDQPLVVTGGTPPYAWSVTGGVLPTGLRLDPDGHLRGVAKDPGSTTITVSVADHWKAGTKADIQLTIDPPSEKPPQKDDQAKDDKQQEQDKQDQSKQDKGDKADKQDGKDGQQGKQDGQSGEQDKQDAAQAGKDKAEKEQAAQAESLNQTAADRWLDQLPDERRDALRHQLLDGMQKTPKQHGKAW